MDPALFEQLMELDKSGRVEELIRESRKMLAEATNPDEKASLLGGILVACSKLGRLNEARKVLD